MATHEKVDVAIVGAGASGSVYAAVLAKAGKKVALLESGPDWQLTDLISSDFWGRRIKPASGPFLLEGKNPFGYVYQAGWGVGGAALHYFANFPRLLPNDFKIKSEHGRALDWPISYDDVAPYYDKVAEDIGVSRVGGARDSTAISIPSLRRRPQKIGGAGSGQTQGGPETSIPSPPVSPGPPVSPFGERMRAQRPH